MVLEEVSKGMWLCEEIEIEIEIEIGKEEG